jgi:hypothetical protein
MAVDWETHIETFRRWQRANNSTAPDAVMGSVPGR